MYHIFIEALLWKLLHCKLFHSNVHWVIDMEVADVAKWLRLLVVGLNPAMDFRLFYVRKVGGSTQVPACA